MVIKKDKLCDIVIKSEIPEKEFLSRFGSIYFCSKDKRPIPINLAEDYCKQKQCPSLKDYHPNNPADDVDSV